MADQSDRKTKFRYKYPCLMINLPLHRGHLSKADTIFVPVNVRFKDASVVGMYSEIFYQMLANHCEYVRISIQCFTIGVNSQPLCSEDQTILSYTIQRETR